MKVGLDVYHERFPDEQLLVYEVWKRQDGVLLVMAGKVDGFGRKLWGVCDRAERFVVRKRDGAWEN